MPKFLGTIVIPKSTSSPSAVSGGEYFNTSVNKKYYSDGSNWIKENTFDVMTTKFSPFSHSNPYAITKLGSKYFLVGSSNIGISSSTSVNVIATSWITAATVTATMYSIVSNNLSTIVAVGTGGTIMTSTNGGTSFTQQTSGVTTSLYKVTFGNGTFVAVGASGVALTSTNGTSWTTRTSGHGTAAVYSVAWIPYTASTSGYFMTGGTLGKVFYSAAGTTWTQITTNANTAGSVYDIVPWNYSGSSWIAYIINSQERTLSSTNGTTLTAVPFTYLYGTLGGKIWYVGADGSLNFVSNELLFILRITSSLTYSYKYMKGQVQFTTSGVNINLLDYDSTVAFLGSNSSIMEA